MLKRYALIFTFLFSSLVHAHEMQHGFIISDDDQFFSHLVAQGHHSHQLDVSGELVIPQEVEREIYLKQKELNIPMKKTFFLFQAQKLNLPETKEGQMLKGHIIESAVGDYDPKNVIVREAQIIIKKVHINLINPFFVE